MGFLDKAKAAATDLAAKADTALSQASANLSGGGDVERLLRDYGLMVWRRESGQPIDESELQRVTAGLQQHEGRLRELTLHTTPPPPPPPPGSYQAPPPPGDQQAPPPPEQYVGQPAQPDAHASEGGVPGQEGSRVPPPPPPPPGF